MKPTENKYNGTVKVPKILLATVKVLEATSPKLAAKFAIKLFTTPVKHALPKREQEMDRNSVQERVSVPEIGKDVNVYSYGTGEKKILLIHGWSGRGTQLCSIADCFVKKGYTSISFDAPAHGKSPGKTSDMTEFVESILELERKYGPFEYAVGHSLGAMALLNAIRIGMKTDKAAIIGSGDIIKDIMDSFWNKLGMEVATGNLVIKMLEKKFGKSINSYSAYVAATEVAIPVLVIHDQDDKDVPVSAAYHIAKHLTKSQLMITQGLGHRKILGDKNVIKEIQNFFGL